MSHYGRRSSLLAALSVFLAAISVTGAAIPQAPARTMAAPGAAPSDVTTQDRELLASRKLIVPVKGVAPRSLVDNFEEGRGARKHAAIDILAPRGTPVIAADDGRVAKLFTSAAGGITVYQFDRDEKFIYYYAHLDRYAPGLKEGAMLKRGDTLGEVGTTGNAPKNTPHLHFTIFRVGAEKKWWKGTPVNPYPFLAGRTAAPSGG